MKTFTSKIQTILHNQEDIFTVLSDFNNLSAIEDKLPKDKVQDLRFDSDTVSAKVDMIGKISLRIIDREPFKTIKVTAEGVPSEAYLWLQLKEVAPGDTRIKLTLKAKLNGMMKMMLKGKIQEFLDGFSQTLTQLDYKALNK